MKNFNSKKNWEASRKAIGYVNRKEATQQDYDRIGFMSGLEVHQQLLTASKLFCRCPAGIFQKEDQFDAELLRHMRPTLSELGGYDGTALMEFKTRKDIIYRICNKTACTYEVDDTPPFPIDRQALEIAIEVALLSKMNIVGEVHITRKQYLDGSIPTGFQRTAIIGVGGDFPLGNKKIRLIQMSIEEDACREVSDIGHTRIYRTDRLGMPLIETVTYPDMVNPEEVKAACDYIRFLNRSTGKVRIGIGAGREDVNVSCYGGTRVEIKGVAHTKWIPELTHNECFRQWALLHVREVLLGRIQKDAWKMEYKKLNYSEFKNGYQPLAEATERGEKLYAVNLPHFGGLLSHFDQPGKAFYDEFADRLKVIACLEHPNMICSEDLEEKVNPQFWGKVCEHLNAGEKDAQIVFWANDDDVKTALETIEERALMAFDGIPSETRKSFPDGTTIFERVLPGADRMYPDTDSAPIPLANDYIDEIAKRVPSNLSERYQQMIKWNVPSDTYNYIFTNNLYPIIERINKDLKIDPRYVGSFMGHKLKFVEGHYLKGKEFVYNQLYDLFKYLKDNKIEFNIAAKMIPVLYEHPKMDFDSILTTIQFKKLDKTKILDNIKFLKDKFAQIRISDKPDNEHKWVMGQLKEMSLGNISLNELSKAIK